ncbi:hypothetical protein, partial [Nostoc sp. 2RC]|uniref:hypothetical protein n=1 Tax=Nostoc sp. 2RC TaxID=2485484 RepID=UPI001C895FBF
VMAVVIQRLPPHTLLGLKPKFDFQVRRQKAFMEPTFKNVGLKQGCLVSHATHLDTNIFILMGFRPTKDSFY